MFWTLDRRFYLQTWPLFPFGHIFSATSLIFLLHDLYPSPDSKPKTQFAIQQLLLLKITKIVLKFGRILHGNLLFVPCARLRRLWSVMINIPFEQKKEPHFCKSIQISDESQDSLFCRCCEVPPLLSRVRMT